MFKSQSDEHTWRAIAYPLCLTLIVISGALLRFSHADWDSGYTLHPDERGILFVAQAIAVPDRAAELFSPRHSPFNPLRNPDGTIHPYAYGHLPLYATVAAQRLLSLPCGALAEACENIPPDTFAGRLLNVAQAPRFGHLTYVGRALSALCDTFTILITALLAARLFNKAAGLLAAAMMAFAVLHIQNAHFGTVDSALALFSTLSVLLLAGYARNKRRLTSILAGCAIGLAIGCKASGIVLIVPLVAAHLERVQSRRIPVRLADHTTFWLSALGLGVAFALTNPYAVIDPVPYFSEIATQGGMTAGKFDWPFTRQFIGTAPFVYMIGQQARWTLGLPLTLAGYAGLIWAGWTLRANPDKATATTFVATVTLLVVTGTQFAKFPRYTLPLTPLLATFGAGMLSGVPFKKLRYRRLSILLAW
ncbi:MAG: glycosyltransferase family 39 protein, partial [Chloroflexota bacterium]